MLPWAHRLIYSGIPVAGPVSSTGLMTPSRVVAGEPRTCCAPRPALQHPGANPLRNRSWSGPAASRAALLTVTPSSLRLSRLLFLPFPTLKFTAGVAVAKDPNNRTRALFIVISKTGSLLHGKENLRRWEGSYGTDLFKGHTHLSSGGNFLDFHQHRPGQAMGECAQ